MLLNMTKKLIIALLILTTLGAAIYAFNFLNIASLFQRQKNIPQFQKVDQRKLTDEELANIPLLSTVARNLEIPWAIAFLPNDQILVTERPGRVRLINKDGNLQDSPIAEIDAVKTIGEGGLHGIAVYPDFQSNHFIYLYYTYGESGNQTLNRVSRFTFDGQSLTGEKIIVDGIPGAQFHDGGRIKFGPDNLLYITTGDALNPSQSQDINSLAGKILRVTEDGRSLPDNPFGNFVYSYGHRNPQGITWDSQNRLWETEHGQSATDELNLIEPRQNYGWPTIRGDQIQQGLVSPIKHSGSNTWAPAGAAYLNGSIFFAGLRGQALFEAKIENGSVTLIEHFKNQLGRLREVVVGPDNMLYITTSNRDGRGIPTNGDDQIIRVNPTKL